MEGMKSSREMCLGFVAAVIVLCTSVAWGADEEVKRFPIVKDGKWGYMDETGKVVIEPQYDGAWDFSEGLACVGVGLLRGYIDKTGTMVIEPKFGWAGKFSSGLAPVFGHPDGKPVGARHNDIWGDDVQLYQPRIKLLYVNGNGKTFASIRVAVDYSEGKACCRNLCFGADGKKITHDADELLPFSGGRSAARKGAKWGYLDHSMKWVIAPQFDSAGSFAEDLAPVAQADPPPPEDPKAYKAWRRRHKLKWGYANTTGKIVIPCRFEKAWPFSGKLAPVRVGGKWGYVDQSGTVAIEATYDYAWPFSEGRGRVLVGEKHGFVDTSGKLVIKPTFDVAWEFSKGLARVGTENREGYINPKGAYVWEPTE